MNPEDDTEGKLIALYMVTDSPVNCREWQMRRSGGGRGGS